jgi:hypothetical protein
VIDACPITRRAPLSARDKLVRMRRNAQPYAWRRGDLWFSMRSPTPESNPRPLSMTTRRWPAVTDDTVSASRAGPSFFLICAVPRGCRIHPLPYFGLRVGIASVPEDDSPAGETLNAARSSSAGRSRGHRPSDDDRAVSDAMIRSAHRPPTDDLGSEQFRSAFSSPKVADTAPVGGRHAPGASRPISARHWIESKCGGLDPAVGIGQLASVVSP